jgi:RNA polymerase sigma-70 factor (ECF subfamily)
MQKQIEEIYNKESRRVYATLVRVLGDFDFAEDALQEAFIAALKQWPEEGIPGNPRAWLVSVARFKAIDRLRRHALTQSTWNMPHSWKDWFIMTRIRRILKTTAYA